MIAVAAILIALLSDGSAARRIPLSVPGSAGDDEFLIPQSGPSILVTLQ